MTDDKLTTVGAGVSEHGDYFSFDTRNLTWNGWLSLRTNAVFGNAAPTVVAEAKAINEGGICLNDRHKAQGVASTLKVTHSKEIHVQVCVTFTEHLSIHRRISLLSLYNFASESLS